MSYISDYLCGAIDYEEYKRFATQENNLDWYEKHYPDYNPEDYYDDEVEENESN